MKQNTYILRLACTLVACLLASFFACAHTYSVSLGTNISNAPFIQDTATANVNDGEENFFRLEAEYLPATVCYWSDSIFGPIPVLVNVATDDTLSAVRVSENCRMGWKWSIAEAGEEETVQYLNFSAHENNAMAEIRPTVCMPTGSEVTEEACDSLLWNGEWRKASGDYEFHTINAGGCDSTVTLHLTIHHRVIADAEVVSECNAYTWHNKNYTQSGTYQDTLQTIHNCDSICTLHLTIKQPTAGEESHEACVSYDWNGKTYTESGDYTYQTTNVEGCDSTATLHLTIKQPTAGEESHEACVSYDWNGKTYTESGDYTFKTTNVVGCDSTATLHLTIKQPTTGEETKEACVSYDWNGKTYTESGDYTFKTTNVAGCDSTATLHLTIKQPTTGEETQTACNSYDWHGKTYTESGNYTFNTTNVAGCDSTVTLHLAIHHPTSGEENRDACLSYEWHGTTYTTSGDYTFTTVNVAGCDSIATLHLTIKQPTTGEETQTACNSYDWHGKTYTESGDYTFHTTNVAGCDSTVTLHLTINDCSITYDTVYFCAGQNIVHEEKVSGNLIRRYLVYEYESPAEWDYMEGAILVREKERMQVDLRRAEENLYAHYVNELTPVSNIRWSYRADGESDYRTLEVANEPQWVETGTIAVTVRFVCGQFYTSDFEADVVTVNGEEQTGKKVLENGQIIIIRGGVKYNVLGFKILDF